MYLLNLSLKESCKIKIHWKAMENYQQFRFLKSVSSFVSYTWWKITISHSISSFSLCFEHFDWISWNKEILLKVNTFEDLFSMCSYYHYQDVYHLVHMGHNNYFSVQLLWTDCLQIYSFKGGFYQLLQD